jgi:hypothetical protein
MFHSEVNPLNEGDWRWRLKKLSGLAHDTPNREGILSKFEQLSENF